MACVVSCCLWKKIIRHRNRSLVLLLETRTCLFRIVHRSHSKSIKGFFLCLNFLHFQLVHIAHSIRHISGCRMQVHCLFSSFFDVLYLVKVLHSVLFFVGIEEFVVHAVVLSAPVAKHYFQGKFVNWNFMFCPVCCHL